MKALKITIITALIGLGGFAIADTPAADHPEAGTEAGFNGSQNCCKTHSKSGILSERSDHDTLAVVDSFTDPTKTPADPSSAKANR
jgi:hypothetical protein